MAEPNSKDNSEAKESKPQKPVEYKRFERLLKKVVHTPPLRKHKSVNEKAPPGGSAE